MIIEGILVFVDERLRDLFDIKLFVDTDDPTFRRRLAETATAQRAELSLLVTRAGAELHDVSTDDDLVKVLGKIAALRSRRGGGRVASMGGPR